MWRAADGLGKSGHVAGGQPGAETGQPAVAVPRVVVQGDAVKGGGQTAARHTHTGQSVALQVQSLQAVQVTEGPSRQARDPAVGQVELGQLAQVGEGGGLQRHDAPVATQAEQHQAQCVREHLTLQ